MAKKKAEEATSSNSGSQMLRAPAEILYATELEQLAKEDKFERPPGWRLSARAC